MRDGRIPGNAGAAVDDAHSVGTGNVRTAEVWSTKEKRGRYFFSRTDRAAENFGRGRLRLPALRANDPAGGDLWHHRANERYREGTDAVGSGGEEVECGRG